MIKRILRYIFSFIKKNNIKLLYRPIINRFSHKPSLYMIFPFYQYFNFNGNLARLLKNKQYVIFVYRGDANLAAVRSSIEVLKKHYTVIIVCLSNIDVLFDEFKSPNVYVVASYLFNGLEHDLIRLYENAKLVICIHASTASIVNYCAEHNIKCVWWIHEPKQYLNNRQMFPMIPKLNAWISLWAVSKVSEDAVSKIYPDKQIRVLHNGFNFPSLSEPKKHEKTVILISGGDWIKGLDVLIDALSTLDKKILNKIKLVIIDNNHSDYYYREIRSLLEIEVIQWLPQVQFFEQINSSDIVIIPSYCETLSFVAVQCMAYKKPFICSDTVGIVNYLPKELKTKLVFKNKKSNELSNLIKYYLNNKKEYQKIGEKLYHIYSTEFSLEVFNSRFAELLDEEILPLISIIIPVFNVEKYLKRCLDSIINQTYLNLEIILIDDGSTDNSGFICDEYKEKDKRVSVIHKKNGGLSSARNCGLDKCNGDYIAFVDSDDYVKSDFIKCLYENAKKYKCDVSACSVEQNLPSGNISPLFIFKDRVLPDYLDFSGYCCWNKLYKKEIFKELRFPEGKLSEDLYVYFQIMHSANNICTSSKLLYCYSIMREGSLCNVMPEKQIFDSFEACQHTTDFMIKNNIDKKHFVIWRQKVDENHTDGIRVLKKYKINYSTSELENKYIKLLQTIDSHINKITN